MSSRFITASLIAMLSLSGCYYGQAIRGQLQILNQRQPIDELIADPQTPAELRRTLMQVEKIRAFASRELRLPDNKSYRSYADIGRPYVVWNVFAAEEFSVDPKRWCFPFAGCVAYRGYFSKARAQQFADKLRRQGFDVYVGGVTAYSTLGWFNDPLLNTIIRRGETEIAALIFHELAHQVAYAKGDSPFNESFATTVELEGLKRWFLAQQLSSAYEKHRADLANQRAFARLVLSYRQRFAALYAGAHTVEEKRQQKMALFQAMKNEYQQEKARWPGTSRYDRWFDQPLNNAHLLAVGTYHQHLEAFERLLAVHDHNLDAFYRAVKRLTKLSKRDRDAALAAARAEQSALSGG
jgi:predicted aminopeptidase